MLHRKSKRFINLKHSARKNMAVALRWKIRCATDGLGLFHARAILPGSAEWEALCQRDEQLRAINNMNASVKFLSRKHAKDGWLYHAEITSVPLAVFCRLDALIDQRIEALIKQAGLSDKQVYPLWEWGAPTGYGKNATYELLKSNYPVLDALGGRTLIDCKIEEWNKLTPANWNDMLFESSCLRYDCPTGVDLDLTVPETYIDLNAIVRIIHRFIDGGEVASRGPALDQADYTSAIEELISTNVKQMVLTRDTNRIDFV